MPWRALFSAAAKLREIVIAQRITEPGIGKAHRIQGQQLVGHGDQRLPLLLLRIQFRQAAVGIDVLRIGRDGLLERMARLPAPSFCEAGRGPGRTRRRRTWDKSGPPSRTSGWASSHFSLLALSRPFSYAFCASLGAMALVALMVKPSTWPMRCNTRRPMSVVSKVDIRLLRSTGCEVNPGRSACSSQSRQSRWLLPPVRTGRVPGRIGVGAR